jgi:putative transposase
MDDACKAVAAAKKKCVITGEYQSVHFRAKRDLKQGFGFDVCSLSSTQVFRVLDYRVEFQAAEAVPDARLEGSRIICDSGRWFLIVPVRVPQQQPETQRLPCVALDPGVRTFLTYYADGVNGQLGKGDFARIYRLCLHVDRLISEAADSTARRRQRLRKACSRLRYRIRDMIDELHRKAAHFLVTRFDTIFLPDFRSQQMLGKLRSKTARMMCTFAHFRFRQVLLGMAERFQAKVILGCEAYTSKTCSYCGSIHQIGSRALMKCCAVVCRDGNGARGYYLKMVANGFVGSHLAVNPPAFVSDS